VCACVCACVRVCVCVCVCACPYVCESVYARARACANYSSLLVKCMRHVCVCVGCLRMCVVAYINVCECVCVCTIVLNLDLYIAAGQRQRQCSSLKRRMLQRFLTVKRRVQWVYARSCHFVLYV